MIGTAGQCGGPDKAFHLELLLESLKEKLDLAAVFIDEGDGLGRPVKLIRQKHDNLACFRILGTDPPQAIRIIPGCIESLKLNDLIGKDILQMSRRSTTR